MLTQPHPGRVLRSTGLPQTEIRLNPGFNADIGLSRRALNSGTRRGYSSLTGLIGGDSTNIGALKRQKGPSQLPCLTGASRIHVVFSILF